MNSKNKNITLCCDSITSYTIALSLFIFFSFFTLTDISPESNMWLKSLRLAANFPYLVSIFYSVYIIVDMSRNGLEEIEEVYILLLSISIILFLFGIQELIYTGIGFQMVSKISTLIGLILYLSQYMHTSNDST